MMAGVANESGDIYSTGLVAANLKIVAPQIAQANEPSNQIPNFATIEWVTFNPSITGLVRSRGSLAIETDSAAVWLKTTPGGGSSAGWVQLAAAGSVSVSVGSNLVGDGTPGDPINLAASIATTNAQFTDEMQANAALIGRLSLDGFDPQTLSAGNNTVVVTPATTTIPCATANTQPGAVVVNLIDQGELPFDGSIAIFTASTSGSEFRVKDNGTQAGTAYPFSFGAGLNSGLFVDVGNNIGNGTYTSVIFLFDENGTRSGLGVSTWIPLQLGAPSTVQRNTINASGSTITSLHPGDTFIEVNVASVFAPTLLDIGFIPPPGFIVRVATTVGSVAPITFTTGGTPSGTALAFNTTLASGLSATEVATLVYNGHAWNVYR